MLKEKVYIWGNHLINDNWLCTVPKLSNIKYTRQGNLVFE